MIDKLSKLDTLDFIIFLLIGLFILTFMFNIVIVHGESMQPTYNEKDVLIIKKINMNNESLNYGDIIVTDDNKITNRKLIKRLIGKPGDVIEIKNGLVFRNNKKLNEPYIKGETFIPYKETNTLKITLGEDKYYLLGDNRNNSIDSRVIGSIKLNEMIGKVVYRIK